MSVEWPWSLRACAILDIKAAKKKKRINRDGRDGRDERDGRKRRLIIEDLITV